jgi:hypothetical protein
MEATYSRLAKVLGATAIEASGSDVRFAVNGPQGGVLKISVEGRDQRLMAVLIDANGITRCAIDVAPIDHVREDASFPGRVTFSSHNILIAIDSKPSLAIEITSA